MLDDRRQSVERVIALLLIGYVAYLVIPIVVDTAALPFRRAFALIALLFFSYLAMRSTSLWQTLFGTFRRR